LCAPGGEEGGEKTFPGEKAIQVENQKKKKVVSRRGDQKEPGGRFSMRKKKKKSINASWRTRTKWGCASKRENSWGVGGESKTKKEGESTVDRGVYGGTEGKVC